MTDNIKEIRQQKREQMLNKGAEEEQSVPSEPIYVEGSGHLDEITKKYDVVLVDFYADWCGPCKMIEPVMERLAQNTDAAVAKVDIDQYQMLARQNGVQGVPTLGLYADGEPVQRLVGVQDEGKLANLIEQYA
ncbi:thioredoxin [Haladaptatus sp. NG-SE-30]